MARALYIDGTNRTAVCLDGPSLLVRSSGRAPQRFPLARLGRITAWGDVDWSQAALCGVLQAGIPVVFHTGGREAAGFGIPARPADESLTSRLERFAERGDARGRYSDWLRSEKSRAVRLGRLAAPPPTPPLQSAMAAVVAAELVRNGPRLERLAAFVPWMRPITDWADLLAWRVPERPQDMRAAARLVNDRLADHARELRCLLCRFKRWMGDIEWNSNTRGF